VTWEVKNLVGVTDGNWGFVKGELEPSITEAFNNGEDQAAEVLIELDDLDTTILSQKKEAVVLVALKAVAYAREADISDAGGPCEAAIFSESVEGRLRTGANSVQFHLKFTHRARHVVSLRAGFMIAIP